MRTIRSAPACSIVSPSIGTVATNATWAEDIYFTEAGAPFDISGLDWKLTFRRSGGNTNADITLSSAAGTLTVVAAGISGARPASSRAGSAWPSRHHRVPPR